MMRTVSLVAVVLLACGSVSAQTNSPPDIPARPAAHSAASLPQDRHEGLTVSADSYTESGRAKDKFGKANPVQVGILPVEVFLTNETTQPIRIDMNTIQLEVHFQNGHHQDVNWLTVDEVAMAIAHPGGPPAPRSRRFPLGIPAGADKKTDKFAEILRPLTLDVNIVPPLGTIHGFLFFDLNHDMSLAEGATLYLPDATNVPTKKPLMFFEVALGK